MYNWEIKFYLIFHSYYSGGKCPEQKDCADFGHQFCILLLFKKTGKLGGGKRYIYFPLLVTSYNVKISQFDCVFISRISCGIIMA